MNVQAPNSTTDCWFTRKHQLAVPLTACIKFAADGRARPIRFATNELEWGKPLVWQPLLGGEVMALHSPPSSTTGKHIVTSQCKGSASNKLAKCKRFLGHQLMLIFARTKCTMSELRYSICHLQACCSWGILRVKAAFHICKIEADCWRVALSCCSCTAVGTCSCSVSNAWGTPRLAKAMGQVVEIIGLVRKKRM